MKLHSAGSIASSSGRDLEQRDGCTAHEQVVRPLGIGDRLTDGAILRFCADHSNLKPARKRHLAKVHESHVFGLRFAGCVPQHAVLVSQHHSRRSLINKPTNGFAELLVRLARICYVGAKHVVYAGREHHIALTPRVGGKTR